MFPSWFKPMRRAVYLVRSRRQQSAVSIIMLYRRFAGVLQPDPPPGVGTPKAFHVTAVVPVGESQRVLTSAQVRIGLVVFIFKAM